MPASPVALPKPLPKIAPQVPLWNLRICGTPKVLPRLLPQFVAFAQFSVDVVVVTPAVVVEVVLHSPMTVLAAFDSENERRVGDVERVDRRAARPHAADEPGMPLSP